jgi:hypothetical protein
MPLSRSHARIVPSLPPETARRPSALMATADTGPPWPTGVRSGSAVAPTLAPEDTPSRYGSARALRTRTWTTVPAVASVAPTSAASSTRGSRISQTIASATVSRG